MTPVLRMGFSWEPTLQLLSYAAAIAVGLGLLVGSLLARPALTLLVATLRARATSEAQRAALDKFDRVGTLAVTAIEQTTAAHLRASRFGGRLTQADAAVLATDYEDLVRELMGPKDLDTLDAATGTLPLETVIAVQRESKVSVMKSQRPPPGPGVLRHSERPASPRSVLPPSHARDLTERATPVPPARSRKPGPPVRPTGVSLGSLAAATRDPVAEREGAAAATPPYGSRASAEPPKDPE